MKSTTSILVVIALSLGIGLLSACTSLPNPFASAPTSGDRIAYVQKQRNCPFGCPPPNIYVMRADGSSQTRLTSNGDNPTWSPDGKRILFTPEETPGSQILYLMNADGGGVQRLTEGDSGAWSPDGKAIAVYSVTGDIDLINADGSGRRKLAGGGNFAWSPDGQKIAYQNGGLMVMNADGTGKVRLADDGVLPSWSPDSKRIAYEVFIDTGNSNTEQHTVAVINADGSCPITFTRGQNPVWSPDGTRIVFTKGFSLFVMNPDGTGQLHLAENASYPSWSPDGKRIAYTFIDDPSVWVINADGTSNLRLAQGENPKWAPSEQPVTFSLPPLPACPPGVQAKPTATPQGSQWPVVLSENFDNNDHGWHTGSISDQFGTVNRTIQGGRYHWEGKAIETKSSDFTRYRDSPSMNPVSDFSLTATFETSPSRFPAFGITFPVGGTYGLVFRDDGENFYVFEISGDTFARLWLFNDHVTKLLYEAPPEELPSLTRRGEPNQLGVIAEGAHFTFFINGKKVGEANDSTLTKGKVGIAITLQSGEQAVTEFDDFELRAP